MALARIAGALGKALMAAGLILLLFAAYQLWGTGLEEARAQEQLREELREAFDASPAVAGGPPAGAAPAEAPAPTEPPAAASAPAALAHLRIPAIGLDKVVVSGVGVADLRRGPGHYPGTPLPGQPGNAALAGHRSTYGAPFARLDELEAGDEIFVRTRQGAFTYEVTGHQVVSPADGQVLDDTPDDRLTLTTCHPRFSARQRLVVIARLRAPPAPPAPAAAPEPGLPVAAAPGAPVAGTPVEASPGEEFGEGLAGDPGAAGPAAAWAAGALAVAVLAWALGRAWRRPPVYAVATPVVLLLLLACFRAVDRLLPAY